METAIWDDVPWCKGRAFTHYDKDVYEVVKGMYFINKVTLMLAVNWQFYIGLYLTWVAHTPLVSVHTTLYSTICTSFRSSIPICSAVSLQWELVYAAKPVRLPNTLEMAMHLAIRNHYYVERVSLVYIVVYIHATFLWLIYPTVVAHMCNRKL